MNQIERWFAAPAEKQLRRNGYRATREWELAVGRYLEITNKHATLSKWTETKDQILARHCKIFKGLTTQELSANLI